MSASSVKVSNHCRLRYTQRVGIDSPCLHSVWENATPVDIEYREDADARFDESTGVVLLMRDGVLITALQAEYEDFSITATPNCGS
jgi:hypothetical protein